MQAQAIDSVARIVGQVAREATHVASLNGGSVRFNIADYDDAVADLVAKHGPGVPQIAELGGPRVLVSPSSGIVTPVVAPAPEKPAQAIAVGAYDAEGDARSQRDRDAAVAAGFSPAKPVYRQGLRAFGMRKFRAKFDAMPLASAAADDLVRTVAAEQRQDLPFLASAVRLNKDGLLALGRRRLSFSGRAFQALAGRLQMPNGAGSYLPNIDAELRAVNVNKWVTERYPAFEDADRAEHEEAQARKEPKDRKPFQPTELVFRTRNAPLAEADAPIVTRECFGVVSDAYGEFDADRIAQAIKLAIPDGARARVAYDGRRTKFDVIFFSNIEPEHAVAGEFFQAAVQVRTDDTGGGSLVVAAALHQNLCLNFIILDKAMGAAARIRHLGSTEELAKKFREAFDAALKQIEHFTKAWGYAQEEDAAARALVLARQTGALEQEELDDYVVRPVSEVLPGIFNGIIERELVPLPKKNRAETVKQLMAMWEKDESAATRDRQKLLTRAAVVNAFTRYAHEVNEDPFVEAEIESAAGALLYGKAGGAPGPLPFSPLPKAKATA